MQIQEKKIFLRKKYLKIRQDLVSNFSIEEENNLIFNLFSLDEFKRAKTILSYMSKDNETPTANLNLKILEQKKILCLPKTDFDNKNLLIKQISSFEDLEKGPFGLLEPKKDSKSLDSVDLAIIPGIAFDKNGTRLGYGLGYYDKFLEQKNFFKIGLCFSSQVVDNLPFEKHDVKMDCLVTEKFILRFKK